jgi:hypothetical protein
MKNLRSITYYLKLHVERDRQARNIYFTQTAYIDRIFKKAEIQDCRSASIFMDSKLQLQKATKDSEIIDKNIYASRIG